VRQIKKYANRKFYDTEKRRYVSLSGIASLVRAGEDVQVLDNQSGNDITGEVLSQILRDQERQGGLLPHAVLTALVRRGTWGLEHLRGSLHTTLDALGSLEDDLDQRIDTLADKGEISLSEAQEFREELIARARERQADREERILQEIEDSLIRLGVPARQDVDALTVRLAEIEAKLDSLLTP
jgi:polyhydroxyalkanoate synthesis repressor PhaR